ncbi:nicotinamide riboside transporter PnuC [Mycoplasmopsis cynos]|uniref:Nicotinamide mononucleotide transporter PnuC n=2 Tax=Mycoplasmopsis cynos TaxID=171284 RepID=A0A449AIC2_9BACT|nr:nicotinamide riboside transporter PnuC [Mycoplasmopsis cynos]TQC54845.1 transporter [Mycoplasmopsis cynos]VEU64743.1 Uncharacterised protein [Mycoplasmopsis cynos]
MKIRFKNKKWYLNIIDWKVGILSLLIIFLIFNTLYSFDYGSWIWDGDLSPWQKTIGICVSLSAILGVLSVVLFAVHKNLAYVLGIVNAILFSLFAFSFGLAIEGFTNFFIYIPIMILMWYKTTRIKNNKKQFESFRSNTYSTIFFIFLTFILTIAFYYINPNLNKVAIQIFGKDKVYEYGSNFKYFEIASIINSLITALSIVALTMMVLGFRESWTIWIIKNVFSFIFFGGIGFLNITTLLINVTYMCISIYLYLVTTNKQKLRIAFSNKINFENTLKFLKAKEFYLSLSQQSALNNFDFKTENKILKSLLKEIKKSQFEDNVIFDNYLLDHILALKKYQLSSFIKKIKRDYLVFKYKISLALQNKLNYIFIYTESNNFEAYKNKKNWKKFTKKVVFLSTNKEKSLNEIKNIIKVELNKKTTSNFEKIFKRLFA